MVRRCRGCIHHANEISTAQPVNFPYDCISKEFWDNNVVECSCGTLALTNDTRVISTPSLGSVIIPDDYWSVYVSHVARAYSIKTLYLSLMILSGIMTMTQPKR